MYALFKDGEKLSQTVNNPYSMVVVLKLYDAEIATDMGIHISLKEGYTIEEVKE